LVTEQNYKPDEPASLRDHYMRLQAEGPKPGDMVADSARPDDPLVQFPRMIHMQRWDDRSLQWPLDDRLKACLAVPMGEEPLAVSSML